MSYLSMTNVFMKTQHRFLQDSPTTTATTTNIPQTRNLMLTPNNSSNNNNNNNQLLNNNEKIQQVWSNYNFDINNIDNNFNENKLKMSWTINCNNNNNNNIKNNNNNNNDVDEYNKMQETENNIKPINLMVQEKEATIIDDEIPPPTPSSPINNDEKYESSSSSTSPSHHARRPPNAFLIFCKKHRPIVRSKYPSLENRGVTKILGEWWALLDDNDKAPYTQLAKEYKDAFLSANPDFKWYKLPAPPLRTLNVRPNHNNNNCNVHKVPSPISSPVSGNLHTESEFTPGKLADESQLGNLTALMNNNSNNNNNNNNTTTITPKTIIINENNNNSIEKSPVNLITTHLPPAPIKKRISQKYLDNRNIARNLMENISAGEFCNNNNNNNDDDDDDDDNQLEHNDNDNYDDNEINDNSNNMTNQELMNKVVDKLFTKNSDYDDNNNNNNSDHHHLGLKDSKEIIRKSGRQCKGKRYEKFMSEGRLLSNKRDNTTKLSNNNRNNNDYDDKIDNEINLKLETTIETPNLDYTIKRLAERTNMKNLLIETTTTTNQINEITNDNNNNNNNTATTTTKSTNDFNLDLRISLLPSLSYEVYSQRKKDSKKRKNRIRTNNNNNNNNNDDNPSDAKIPKLARNEQLVGSKKRKNKNSITHLENKQLQQQQQQQDNCNNDSINNDLLGLATLAEVAANTEKINEEVISQ